MFFDARTLFLIPHPSLERSDWKTWWPKLSRAALERRTMQSRWLGPGSGEPDVSHNQNPGKRRLARDRPNHRCGRLDHSVCGVGFTCQVLTMTHVGFDYDSCGFWL